MGFLVALGRAAFADADLVPEDGTTADDGPADVGAELAAEDDPAGAVLDLVPDDGPANEGVGTTSSSDSLSSKTA